MLFRCYSWGSFVDEVDINFRFLLLNPNSTATANTPKWGFNFLQIFISFFLCAL